MPQEEKEKKENGIKEEDKSLANSNKESEEKESISKVSYVIIGILIFYILVRIFFFFQEEKSKPLATITNCDQSLLANNSVDDFNKLNYDALIKNENFHITLGLAYGKAGFLDQAIMENQAVLSINPKSALAYNNIGWYLQEKGLYTEAEKSYIKALELEPSSILILNNLKELYKILLNKSTSLEERKIYQQTIENLNKGIFIPPIIPKKPQIIKEENQLQSESTIEKREQQPLEGSPLQNEPPLPQQNEPIPLQSEPTLENQNQ